MDKESIRLVMTGTHPNGQGGISAVVSILLNAGLFEHFTSRYVVSHVGDGFWRKLATGISAPWRMFHTCRVFRPSVVHAHCSVGASFVRKAVLLSIARRWGAATVLHLHSGRFREFAHDEAGWLRRMLVRRVLRRSSAVIALSDGWAGIVRELVPTANVHVIANAVAVQATPQAPATEPFRILFLGQVGRHKGVYDLVEAVARLKDDFPGMKLIIGGDGELAEVAACARRHGVAEHVELLGWIDSKGKADELRRACLFCLPSYGEGLPVAMLEAMAAARPVVVTPVGGIPEMIVDGSNGLLVPPGDVDALAAALRRLFGDPALSLSLALRGHQAVRERFDAQEMVRRLGTLYESLRPGGRASPEPAPVQGESQGTSRAT